MLRIISICFAVFPCAIHCQAAMILETASPGPTPFSSGATAIGSPWMAARFVVSEPTQITSVGGHLRGTSTNGDTNTLFAAILELDNSTAFPYDGLITDRLAGIKDEDVVAHTIFNLPTYASQHISLPLSVIVSPGDYALVFGSGLFGATGSGAMPANNPANLDQLSLMGWWESIYRPSTGERLWRWNNQNFVYQGNARRFIVEGFAVPEPSTLATISMALLAAMAFARSRHSTKHS